MICEVLFSTPVTILAAKMERSTIVNAEVTLAACNLQ